MKNITKEEERGERERERERDRDRDIRKNMKICFHVCDLELSMNAGCQTPCV
jgi:hypothetical protein